MLCRLLVELMAYVYLVKLFGMHKIGRNVSFEGRTLSLTKLTKELRQQPDRPIRGPAHWSYNGRLLGEMYEETYGDD